MLRAPATKKKDAGIVGGLAAAGAVVGGLLGGKGGAVGGAVVGGAAGVAVVTTDKGREVTLGSRATLSLEVAEAFRSAGPKGLALSESMQAWRTRPPTRIEPTPSTRSV